MRLQKNAARTQMSGPENPTHGLRAEAIDYFNIKKVKSKCK